MNKTIKLKTVTVILIIINVLTIFNQISYASEIWGANIYYSHDCGRHLQYYKENGTLSYVVIAYVQYDYNGKQYPAYCMNSNKPGVGNLSGELENCNVSINKMLEDDRIWRVIINGYPYKSANQLGVENNDDAYVATKHAIYSILNQRDIRGYYHAPDQRGEKIINAIESLVNIGINGTQTKASAKLNIKKLGSFNIDAIDSNYYSQQYNVTSEISMSNYEIISTQNFPEGSIITDLTNNQKTNFSNGEKFKILIPKDKITSDIKGTINIQGRCETYPIFYGESEKEGYQNYAVCYDVNEKCDGSVILEEKTHGKVTATKRSSDDNIWTEDKKDDVLKGAVYEIRDENNKVVTTLTTDENGQINAKLDLGKYTIQEIEPPENYEKDENIYSFTLSVHEQTVNLELFDFPIEGGFFNIEKTSQDNNLLLDIPENTALKGATYVIKDDLGQIVETVTTNEKGTLDKPVKLKVGLYSIQETVAPEGYKLDESIKYFKIEKNGETVKINLKDNSIIVGTLKIKKTSENYNKWTGQSKGEALQGAIYEIRDLNNNLINTIQTDQNGEAQINLEEGKYTIKEIQAPEYYILDETVYSFEVNENEQEIHFDFLNKSVPKQEKKLPRTGM